MEVAVIGTGWCGGIRAETPACSVLVDKLHICEILPESLAEVKDLTKPVTAMMDYNDIVSNPAIEVVYNSTTFKTTHYPIAKTCLEAGKYVLLEKSIALELDEASALFKFAKDKNHKFRLDRFRKVQEKLSSAMILRSLKLCFFSCNSSSRAGVFQKYGSSAA